MHDRFKLLLWKVTWEILPTKVKVAGRLGECDLEAEGIYLGLCGEGPETLQHLIFFCSYSRVVWSESPWQLNIVVYGMGALTEWVQAILHPHKVLGIPLEDQLYFQLYAVIAIDFLWMARNEVVHGGRKWAVQESVYRVRKLGSEHLEAW